MNEDYVKVYVKNHHDKKDDVVCRRLHREFVRQGYNELVEGDNAILLATINPENGQMTEFFTGKELVVPSEVCEIVKESDLLNILKSLRKKEIGELQHFIGVIVFNVLDNDYYIDTMRERSLDRGKLFEEYENDLTDINPYSEEHMINYDDIMKRKVLK